jgi:xylose isomerase
MEKPLLSPQPTTYRFSFGPWNISEGADPFGPNVRDVFAHGKKFGLYRSLGFEGVQLHDDDAVPDIDSFTAPQVAAKAKELGQALRDEGLEPEFVAPRLWFPDATIDGAFTSNSDGDRQYAWDRTQRAVDVARAMGCKTIGFWFAREGTYVREAKSAKLAYERLLAAINRTLAYDPEIQVWIEPKPNEPMDMAYVPTAGHAIALAYASESPSRVKVIIESAHALLANLDPSDEMAFCLAHDKLGSIHLNDQNGLKYDQDKNFGSVNLRGAFNQVMVLEEGGYGRRGEFVGLDVKTMRTQRGVPVTEHLASSRRIFLDLVDKARSLDRVRVAEYRGKRDYEGLELYTLEHLLGRK